MKITPTISIIAIITMLLFQSCKKDDEYFGLSQEAKNLLLFEVGDTFQLRNHNTDEIITFTVDFKEIDFYKGGTGSSQMISFGPKRDRFYEYGEYTFSDASDCFKGSVVVLATQTEEFDFRIGFLDICSDVLDGNFTTFEQPLTDITIEGILYTNVYSLRSYVENISYSAEKGILKIENIFDGELLFSIVE
jgi:hypothetical protein